MLRRIEKQALDVLTSLKLAIVCLAALMVLVVACTLAQVRLGMLGAVNAYIRSFVVWYDIPNSAWSIPVFPGGATVGLILGTNLVAAQLKRLELSWKKAGLWVIHAGLILLFVGEFVTSAMQTDSRLTIEEGQTVNFVERFHEHELAVVDVTDPAHDDVYGIPASRLAEEGTVSVPGTPVSIRVKRFLPNAHLSQGGGAPTIATAGVGPSIAVAEQPLATADDEVNRPAAFVEPIVAGTSKGTWLVSQTLQTAQAFTHGGRTYVLAMRPMREYLPYALTLKNFSHDVYAGTDIPKNFSSLVRLSNPSRREERDVLIYMNQPLRYEGKAFYQASFGKGDTLSVLQVVENPGWLLPYISCVLVALGLIIHFSMSLRRGSRRAAAESRRLQPEAA